MISVITIASSKTVMVIIMWFTCKIYKNIYEMSLPLQDILKQQNIYHGWGVKLMSNVRICKGKECPVVHR